MADRSKDQPYPGTPPLDPGKPGQGGDVGTRDEPVTPPAPGPGLGGGGSTGGGGGTGGGTGGGGGG